MYRLYQNCTAAVNYTVSRKSSTPDGNGQFLTDFQNFFTAGKRSKFPTKRMILPTIPSVCCHTALRKLEVRICGNLKKQSKNRVHSTCFNVTECATKLINE